MKKSIICPLVLLAMLGVGGIAPLRATAIAQAVEHDAQSIAVTGIADVYGDGEKISAAVLVYPREIYGTGQSQGGMTNIAISDKYPDLFAGQLLVACQWNVDEMEAMKDKNLWIVVCEGDTKAFPGMNAATERWESLGSKVARNAPFWNSKASAEEIAAAMEALEKQGAHIHYSVFQGGNHMYTWSFAYNIEPIRDWLFRQTK